MSRVVGSFLRCVGIAAAVVSVAGGTGAFVPAHPAAPRSVPVSTVGIGHDLKQQQYRRRCGDCVAQRRVERRQNVLRRSLFGGLFGGERNGEGDSSTGTAADGETVIDLPASTVKIGPLRFFLQIYIVGEQNKPTKDSWLLQNSDDGCLNVYYKDGSAMFSIDMRETGIQILRKGQRPTLEYRLQESVMLHGILDELDGIAFGVDDIAVEKRLLQFDNDDAIEVARSSLPARPGT